MGMSPVQLLIILAIVVVLFGTKRLRHLGTDLGGAIKGFRSSMNDSEDISQVTKKKNPTIDTDMESESNHKVK